MIRATSDVVSSLTMLLIGGHFYGAFIYHRVTSFSNPVMLQLCKCWAGSIAFIYRMGTLDLQILEFKAANSARQTM